MIYQPTLQQLGLDVIDWRLVKAEQDGIRDYLISLEKYNEEQQ